VAVAAVEAVRSAEAGQYLVPASVSLGTCCSFKAIARRFLHKWMCSTLSFSTSVSTCTQRQETQVLPNMSQSATDTALGVSCPAAHARDKVSSGYTYVCLDDSIKLFCTVLATHSPKAAQQLQYTAATAAGRWRVLAAAAGAAAEALARAQACLAGEGVGGARGAQVKGLGSGMPYA
jgi:hypothetical protein